MQSLNDNELPGMWEHADFLGGKDYEVEGLKPFFVSSDTGAKVYLLDGDPKFLDFRIGESSYKISLPIFLEMYKLFNGIWYGGLWRMLDICNSGFCSLPSGHARTKDCPQMTDYEKKQYDEYCSRVRELHMAENRPPIADGEPSNNAQ